MNKKITSSYIAELANVSRATVSYVLNGRDDIPISPETKSRILKLANELNYVPNYSARALVTGKTNLVRLWLASLSSYHMQIAHEFDKMLSNTIYDTVVIRDKSVYNHSFNANGIHSDGMLAFDDKYFDIYKYLKGYHNMPYVSTGVYYDKSVTHVAFDIRKSIHLALNHLKDCGCKKIACFLSAWMVNDSNIYYNAYIDFCKSHNMDVKLVVKETIHYDIDVKQHTYNTVVKYLDENSLDFDGIFVDAEAVFVLSALKHKNIAVPEDVKLCSNFGVIDYEYCDVPITSIELGYKELCKVGWEFLSEQMEKGVTDLKSHIITPKLIVRKSTVN